MSRRVIPGPFGERLRHFRTTCGMSQLRLAEEADTTARHVSFLETGRSRPGRDLVLRLASALDLPIRERNAMLSAAGLPSAFDAHELSDDAMEPVRRVLDRVLAAHEPYPAWVFRAGFEVVAATQGADALFPGLSAMSPAAIVDLWFGPGPFRELVENWRECLSAGVATLRRDATRGHDPKLLSLLRRAEAHARRSGGLAIPASPDLVVCPRFRVGDRVVRTISAVLRFDTAIEVTTSELRVELMYPADDASDAFFREHGRGIDGGAGGGSAQVGRANEA